MVKNVGEKCTVWWHMRFPQRQGCQLCGQRGGCGCNSSSGRGHDVGSPVLDAFSSLANTSVMCNYWQGTSTAIGSIWTQAKTTDKAQHGLDSKDTGMEIKRSILSLGGAEGQCRRGGI